MSIEKQKLYRIVDANFNRAKEGLRVCEDICRFIYDDKTATKKYKHIRHRLTSIISLFKWSQIILARDIVGDVGKPTIDVELKRKKVQDIFYANSQRVKESVRVLEEFTKLFNKKAAQALKELRYQVYDIEKKIVGKM